jgi:hypothetical protein
LHGCKYGEPDCPVQIRAVEQDGPCQVCTEYFEEDVRTTLDNVETLRFLAKHPQWYKAEEARVALVKIFEEMIK